MRGALAFAAVLLASCASSPPFDKAIAAGATFATVAEPVLIEVYAAEQRACLEQLDEPYASACVDNVRRRWRPVVESYEAMRAAWCAVDASVGSGGCPP